MWKSAVGWLLILVSVVFSYGAWTYWDLLTTWASFLVGNATGACLIAGLLLVFWRPSHPATRYTATLPSPWNRNRWH